MSERRAFGDRARRQRERRGVTLESIARATKVPASLFAGLERGDCSRWPSGLYSRAYVRAYAEAIGLDPNEAVEDFTAAFGDTVWPDRPAAPRKTRGAVALRLSMEDQPEVRQGRVLRRLAVAGLDLSAALGVAWIVHLVADTTLWTTVGLALAAQATAQLISDEPLVGWIIGRYRSTPTVVDLGAGEDVSVTDPASTTA